MYKTSALKCGKCPEYTAGICRITGRIHNVNDNCDVNSDEKELRSGSVSGRTVHLPKE